MKKYSIAIDGPSGAGKSTIAKLLAEELNFLYVDTGAIYRTVGLFAKQENIDPQNVSQVTELLKYIHIRMDYGDDGLQHMYLNDKDVTDAIREHVISDYASKVSAIAIVRKFLMEMQQELARQHNVIMDGRDIGTVVLPHADLKLFLTATPEDRAYRRYADLKTRGQQTDYETVLRDIQERDERDIHRDTAPLRQAEDALLVDTTGETLNESLDKLRSIVREKLKI